MNELNHKVKPASDVILTELENKEAVLLHLGTKMYYSLNPTGLRIWQLLSSGLTAGEAGGKIHVEFDVSAEKASESVMKLINDLSNEKLIEVIDG